MDEEKDILLAKWLSNELTESEREYVENTYDLEALIEILDAQNDYTPATVSSDQMWENIISQKNSEQNQEPNQTHQREKKGYPKNTLLLIFVLVSLLAVLAYFLFNRDSATHIETQNESSTEQFFADGSRVLIGPNSKITYSSQDWNEKRDVKLSGQAFFKVENGKSFKVITKAGEVEVLGTEFDVWNIHPEYMRVSCKEGKVRVTDNSGNSKIIRASEYVYIVNDEIKEIETTSDPNLDWQGNFRNFKTTPMSIVLSDLERFYSVDFDIEKSIANDLFTGVLPINDLDKCVKYIETSLSYESKKASNGIIFKASN